MKEQMELFMDGGLRDEGGTTDPVSGNDVPVGSTQEEVRDDIPAQLSEGEFVLPADVVRYHGLEKIMELRDEAKAGLQRMEAMGQMGNSEEATIPDGIPFDMDDLETEDDGREYQVGGYVAPPSPFGVNYQQGAAGPQQYTSQFAGYAQQPATQPAVVAPPPPPPPTQQFTPISTKTAPDFGTFVTPRYVTYVDANGNTIQIPVDENGNPLIPVPAGYSPQGQTASTPTTTDATAGTGTGTGAPQTFISEGGNSGPSVSTSEDSGSGLSTSESDIAAFKLLENAQGLLGSSYGEQVKGIQDKYKFNPFSPLSSIIGEFKEKSEIKAAREEQIKNLADAAGLSVEDTTNVLSTLSDEIKSGYRAADTGVVSGQKTIGEPSTKTIDDIDEFGNIAPDGTMPITDITKTATKVEDITKTAQDNQAQADAAAGVGVESAQVRQAGTTATEAVDVSPEVKTAMDSLQAAIDKAGLTGRQRDNFLNNVIAQKEGSTTSLNKDLVVNYFPEATESLAADYQIAAARLKDSGPSVVSPSTTRTDSDSGVPDFVKSTPSRVSTRSTSTGRPDIPSLTASERADMEAAEDEGGSAFDSYGQAFDRNYDNARNRGYSDSGAREYAANKTDSDREAQEQTGSSFATSVTSSDGTAVRTSSGNVVTNDYRAAEQQDSEPSGGCVIATHGVSTGGFSLRDKAKAEIWCEKTYHGKWYGEAFRRGYRYYANRAVQKGVAHEYYSEFKNFVACGRGLKTDIKSKLNYYRRTVQFFVTGLFVQ